MNDIRHSDDWSGLQDYEIDPLDLKIIEYLQSDGRISYSYYSGNETK
jgi:hypothetical protein